MKNKFLSFVFPETTKKQIDSMPAEMKLKFYEAVTDYGMYGTEPEGLSELEMVIWIPMKDLIDNCKASRGGAPENNQNAKKQPKQPSTEENNQNNVDLQKTTETTLNNGNGNVNDKVNENVNTHNDKERVCASPFDPNPPKNTLGTIQIEIYNLVKQHNQSSPQDRKIPISKSFMIFVQKEARELISVVGVDEPPERVIQAFKNFLQVAESDTWQKSFSWRTFCRNYESYTPEYFTLSKYLNDTPETDDATKKPENIFRQAHKDDPHFSRHAFRDHIAQWQEAGRPDGEAYYRLQDEWVRQGPPEECRELYDTYDDFEPREVANAV